MLRSPPSVALISFRRCRNRKSARPRSAPFAAVIRSSPWCCPFKPFQAQPLHSFATSSPDHLRILKPIARILCSTEPETVARQRTKSRNLSGHTPTTTARSCINWQGGRLPAPVRPPTSVCQTYRPSALFSWIPQHRRCRTREKKRFAQHPCPSPSPNSIPTPGARPCLQLVIYTSRWPDKDYASWLPSQPKCVPL